MTKDGFVYTAERMPHYILMRFLGVTNKEIKTYKRNGSLGERIAAVYDTKSPDLLELITDDMMREIERGNTVSVVNVSEKTPLWHMEFMGGPTLIVAMALAVIATVITLFFLPATYYPDYNAGIDNLLSINGVVAMVPFIYTGLFLYGFYRLERKFG